MKHTDVLLGIKPLGVVNAEKANERRATEQELNAKVIMVQTLVQTNGWKFFVSELAEEEYRLLGMLERTADPTTLAKVTGTLLAVKSFADWPSTVLREVAAAVKELQDNKE